jgi:hypothetical protein
VSGWLLFFAPTVAKLVSCGQTGTVFLPEPQQAGAQGLFQINRMFKVDLP